jgi:hypothetical protein
MSRICLLILVLSVSGVSEAFSKDTPLRLNFYVREALNQRYVCTSGSPLVQGIPCRDFAVGGLSLNTPYYVYLVAASEWESIGGFTCGIRYDPSIAVLDWNLCAPAQYSLDGWPASGSGNAFQWYECQSTSWLGSYGAEAVAGAFYVIAYGDGLLEATPHYLTPPNYELTVTDCVGKTFDGWFRGGAVGFGAKHGINTCSDWLWICPSGYEFRHCCCAPGSAVEFRGYSILEQTCEFTGGRIVNGLCDLDCEEICAQYVATERQTWGRIKTRFK